jgi:hypothetical protein
MKRTEPSRSTEKTRGQAHVLEGIVAALLILTSVIFALQVTAVTPLTASTANQHLQTQGAGTVSGLLVAADDRGTLRDTVLYWNESASRFHNSGAEEQYTDSIPTEFGSTLESTVSPKGLIYNVNVLSVNTAGQVREHQMLHQGEPSDQAVSITRSVTLYDDDRLRDENGSQTDQTVGNTTAYFASEVSEGPLYNVVRIEVVVWRV